MSWTSTGDTPFGAPAAVGPATPVLIWGAAGHARVLRDALTRLGGEVVVLVDRAVVPPPWDGAPEVIAPEDLPRWLAAWSGTPPRFLVAIGGMRGADRLAVAALLMAAGLTPCTLAHPTATIEPSARLGPGAQALAGSIVGADATIGAQSILNTRASVDHDAKLGSGCHLAPGAVICGETALGDRVFVGAGAVVGPGLTIGADAAIGAGAVVLRDVAPGTRVWGAPARAR